MKKKVVGTIMLAAALFLSGCNSGSVSVDINTLATDLKDNGVYKDQLSEIDDTTGLTLYGIAADDVKDCIVILGSGATAEEIAVFEAADSEAAAAIKTACENRIDTQEAACENYLPDEMPKLASAVVVESGNYVILCVSEDSEKANSIIDSYIGK